MHPLAEAGGGGRGRRRSGAEVGGGGRGRRSGRHEGLPFDIDNE